MANFTRFLLSESTSGKTIVIFAISTAGSPIHTAIAGATDFDEIYLWASNVTGEARLLTLEWGGASDPDDFLVQALPIPPNSPPMPVATGQMLNGGLIIRAFADVTAAINITGYVNRIAA